MSAEREHLIDIGTRRVKNIQQQFGLVENIVEIFQNNGIFKVETDKVFSSSFSYTFRQRFQESVRLLRFNLN
jgi:hypothetical protein